MLAPTFSLTYGRQFSEVVALVNPLTDSKNFQTLINQSTFHSYLKVWKAPKPWEVWECIASSLLMMHYPGSNWGICFQVARGTPQQSLS